MLLSGETIRLVSGGQVVAGRKLSFINDLAVSQDGKKVYFTSSSSRWQRRDYMHLIMEATADGRYDGERAEAGRRRRVQHRTKQAQNKFDVHDRIQLKAFLFYFLSACWNTTPRAENSRWSWRTFGFQMGSSCCPMRSRCWSPRPPWPASAGESNVRSFGNVHGR